MNEVDWLTRSNTPQRLATYVLALAGSQGERIELPTSQRQLAARLGVRAETLSRLFAQWQARGWIHGESRSWRLCDSNALRRLVPPGADPVLELPRRAPIMPITMESLRRTRHLARLLLACFAVALGVAMLSPLVHAGGMERVCSATDGPRWVAEGRQRLPLRTRVRMGWNARCACRPCCPLPRCRPWQPPGSRRPCAAPAPRQAHVPPLSRAPFPPRAPPVQA
ncbi:cyclic nucleotide-binding protein [Alicycliphilus sp. B1]|nr:cyclic nucleotide-binding protein [Alicycliphilus sp. B1]